jgi:hypothetical protein
MSLNSGSEATATKSIDSTYEPQTLGEFIAALGLSSLPTPLASDAKRLEFRLESLVRVYAQRKEKGRGPGNLPTVLAGLAGIYPSPELYEALMGFPPGWTETECECSVTQSLSRAQSTPSESDSRESAMIPGLDASYYPGHGWREVMPDSPKREKKAKQRAEVDRTQLSLFG